MSRIPPKMKQHAARRAGVYHVLPVQEGDVRYAVTESFSSEPKIVQHFIEATNIDGEVRWKTLVHTYIYDVDLEGDVQDVFVVDLFVDSGQIVVEFEHHGIYRLDSHSGELISQSPDPEQA